MKDAFERTGHPETDDVLACLEAASRELHAAEQACRAATFTNEADACWGFSFAVARIAETLHDHS